MRLHKNFINKVGAGNDIMRMLTSTSTGTGQASGNKVGKCCLDRSSGDWFLCTASTGAGTWVKINA